jgi:dissimilatory sulfite reductase (desulfoviridin) alpha/beta subunit
MVTRKGKTQLHKWAERQVILCGTCLTVASVKDREEGKMHILPLVGGKVRQRLGERRMRTPNRYSPKAKGIAGKLFPIIHGA